MSLDTYSGLKAEVAGFLNKTNLAAQIPTFIALAEAVMRREITSVGHVDNYADVEVTEDGWPLPCHADEVASVFYGDYALTYLSPDRQLEVQDTIPRFYTVDGKTLKIMPAGEVTIRLKRSFCPLSAQVSCNWLLREHPDVYLYGALMQAAPYLRDDERIGVWGGFFAEAISSINRREVRRQVGPLPVVQAGVTP